MRLFLLVSLFLTSFLLYGQEVTVTVSCQEDWPPAKTVPVTITLQNVPAGVFARFHQTFPLGFSVRETEVADADFFKDNNQISFVWLDFPSTKILQVQYLVTPNASLSGSFRLTGTFDYVGADGETRYTAEMSSKLIRLDPAADVLPAEPLLRVTRNAWEPDNERFVTERTATERFATERVATERVAAERASAERVATERAAAERVAAERAAATIPPVKKNSVNNVKYRVQVAIASLQMTRAELEDRIGFPLRHGMTMLRAADFYKYQSGSFEKYQEASIYLEELKKGGVKDAFVVAYRGDEQISVDLARSLER